VTEKSGRKRSFRPDWYKLKPWLEYSQIADAAFCYACRHFPSLGKTAEPAFTSAGFRNWKKAQYSDAGFAVHEDGDFHRDAMVMWQEYKQVKSSAGSVLQLQNKMYAQQVSENRHYVKTVAEVLMLTATQNLAQRGHREDMATSDNPGNFRKILQLVVRHDASIADRFVANSDVVTRYTSKNIQNELLSVMADMVRKQVIDDVKQSVYFSVIVDETKDVSKQEQLSFVLRCYCRARIFESFLDFKPAVGLDGKSLSDLILHTLQSYGLDVKACLVGQGYDGASVMSGANKGVQQRVREQAPLAVYTHCYAHRLNLVLVDCCKSVSDALDFFALLEKLYVFLSAAIPHKVWLEVQRELYRDEPPRQLQRLSDTRWACRVTACRNVRDRFDAVMMTLEEIADGDNADRAVEAKGLMCVLDFKFVLMVFVFCDLLGLIHSVSTQLQCSSINLSCAADLIKTLSETLTQKRESNDAVAPLFDAAETMCNKCGIEAKLVTRRQRKLPKRLAASVVEQTVGQRIEICNQNQFRQHVYLPIIDCVIAELDARFSAQATTVMLGVQALSPKSATFLNQTDLNAFAELYRGDTEDLGHEVYQLKRLLARSESSSQQFAISDMLGLATFMEPYRLAFAELYRLLCIAVVLPVTSAACERSFSSLKLIKTYLRSTMCDGRLSDIAVLSVESKRSQSIDLDSVVDEFDARHQNRKLALH